MLRELIARHFASHRAFAMVVSLSPGRVSQIVGGLDASLSYASASQLIGAFKGSSERDRLYEAWIRTYAPPIQRFESDEVECVLSNISNRIADGELRTVIAELRGLQGHHDSCDNHRVSVEVGVPLVELLYLSDRRIEGIALARKLSEVAKTLGEPILIADTLRLAALGLRHVRLEGPNGAIVAFEHLHSFLRAQPDYLYRTDRSWQDHQASFARDYALLGWELLRQSGSSMEFAEHGLAGVLGQMKRQADRSTNALEFGVAARLYGALGDPDRAWRALEKARNNDRSPDTSIANVSLLLDSARIYSVAGETNLANETIERVLDLADAQGYLHYHREAIRLQLSLHGCREDEKTSGNSKVGFI